MKSKKKIIYAFLLIITLVLNSLAMAEKDNIGQWDSNIYNLLDHPKTVCLRIEVLDSETRLPVQNARISFEGEFWVSPRTSRHPEGKRVAQEIDYKITCRTDSKGISVATFNWQKEYPWSFGTDEVEKAKRIEITHPKYKYVEQKTPFHQFLEIGQKRSKPYPNNDDTYQEIHILEKFESIWAKECARKNVKFCTPRFEKDFPDFDNKKSKHPALFEKIRKKEWGIVHEWPFNRMQWKDKDRRLCGPYLIYIIRIYMDRIEDSYRRGGRRGDSPDNNGLSNTTSDNSLIDDHKKTEHPSKAINKASQKDDDKNLETVTDLLVREMGLLLGTKGVAVKKVIVDSDAARAGLTPNIVIESIEGRIILDVEMLTSKIMNKTDDDQLLIGIWKKGRRGKWERHNMIVYVSAIRSLYSSQVPKEGFGNGKEKQVLLEFRICPILSGASKEDRTKIASYLDYFKQHGPVSYSGTPEYLWKEIYNKEGFNCREAIIEEYEGRSYLLTSNDAKKIHLIKNNTSNWPINNLRETKDYKGQPALEFSLAEREGRQLWLITKRNINSPMAIIVGNKAINAPYISSPIGSNISISGHGIGRSSELISLLTPLLSREKTPTNSPELLPNDEVAFAKQVISALANNNETFFQERRVTPEDWDALVECESFQKELNEELDDGQTIEDLKREFIAIFQQQERIKEHLHRSCLNTQSGLRSKGIDLSSLRIIKCYTEEGEFVIELEGDSKIYEFQMEALKLPRGWVISGDLDGFSVKSILRN